jgi:hypothetical protein
MSLPNAEGAIVDPAKIRDYLLSTAHPVGRFKAVFFISLGYSADQWQILRDDILTLARTGNALPGQLSAQGRKFDLDGILTGPSGRTVAVGTVRILRTDEQFPRFVTAFPR